jgi:small-conductance mechanosensitive channel/CRP-like cAMP-binding protein
MDPLRDGWVWWAILLAVGVPLLLVVLTEILGALARRGHPAEGPVRLLRNWVVPAGALLALLAFAVQSPADQVWVRVVATVLGFLLILLVLSAFNVALFSNAKEGSWQQRIPKIFIEITRLLLVVIGLALLFSWVWEADVGGLIAALGVTSIVIGLALQNAVGGVISGLLLFEQPFKIGDWLSVGSVQGRVIEVNWRAVHLDTGSGIQIVPNASLASASFTNLSKPAGAHHATTSVKFTTDDPPHEVVKLLIEVADSLPMRIPSERATAEYSGAGAYSVTLPLQGPAVVQSALSTYLAWLWYAARRRGLALDGDTTDPLADPARLQRAIEVVGPTLHLGDAERGLVLATAKLERYGTGEIVLPAGVLPHDIRFIVEGHARIAVEVAGGRIECATAEPGDYVGQTALTREKTLTTALAADVLTVLVVPLKTVDELVKARPMLAAEIGRSIEFKRKLAAEAVATAAQAVVQSSHLGGPVS